VGVLALSLALSPSMKLGDRWLIPSELYPPLEQAAILLDSSANKAGARAFLEFVSSDAGREALSQHGFTLSKSSSPNARKQKP